LQSNFNIKQSSPNLTITHTFCFPFPCFCNKIFHQIILTCEKSLPVLYYTSQGWFFIQSIWNILVIVYLIHFLSFSSLVKFYSLFLPVHFFRDPRETFINVRCGSESFQFVSEAKSVYVSI